MIVPAPSLQHLHRLSDAGGLYEHALGTTPRPEHGYCVDDVARGLVVLARQPGEDPGARSLEDCWLRFVLAAQGPDGRFRNRRSTDLQWLDEPSVEDCWGRALWGLGATAAGGSTATGRALALAGFERGARHRSPDARAAAFAGLGAAEVLRRHPEHAVARDLLTDAAAQVDPAPDQAAAVLARNGWEWPEPRLRYANAVLPEVLLLAGSLLGRPELVERGAELLVWLLRVQTRDGHLSVVPVHGLGPGETGPGFDQQPIEVAALADACATAHAVTGRPSWAAAVRLAAGWFLGHNDASTPLLDPDSGGGCDGLERTGRNENQGAESTLALISTLQHARRLATPSPPAAASAVPAGTAGGAAVPSR